MDISIATKEDFLELKEELLSEVRAIAKEIAEGKNEAPEITWLKSHQVQRMLAISPGTLQNLRVNGTIPYTKVGGVIFYDKADIIKVMQENKRNI